MWRAFAEHVAPRLKHGEHTVVLSVRGACSAKVSGLPFTALQKNLATGTFKLTVPASAKLADVMPKPGKKDKKLEGEMAKLLEDKWRGEKVLRLVIVDKDWAVETVRLKDKFVPQRRVIQTKVAVKQPTGCRIFAVSYEQPATSFTAFGATEVNGIGDSNALPCEAVQ